MLSARRIFLPILLQSLRLVSYTDFLLLSSSPFHSTNNHFHHLSAVPIVSESYSLEYLSTLSTSRVSVDGVLLHLATTFPASPSVLRVSACQKLQASDFSTTQNETVESLLRPRHIFFPHLSATATLDYHICLVFWSSDGLNGVLLQGSLKEQHTAQIKLEYQFID